MPQYFKALATILVWILWFAGLVAGFGTLTIGIMRGDLFNPAAQAMPMSYPATFAVAGFFALLALYAMKIRKDID